MCEVQLMRISQNSLHVISTFRIPMMAIRMAQIKAFRRNNGVRCVIVGVASFTYVLKGSQRHEKIGAFAHPCAVAFGLGGTTNL